MDVDADVAGRMRPDEGVDLHVADGRQVGQRRIGADADVHGAGRQGGQRGDAGFEVLLAAGEQHLGARRQWGGFVHGHENVARGGGRVGQPGQRALHEEREQPGTEQRGKHGVAAGGRLRHLERVHAAAAVGTNNHFLDGAAGAAVDVDHHAADRGGEQDVGKRLVVEQGRAHLDGVALFDVEPRYQTVEVARLDGHGRRRWRVLHLGGGDPLKGNVVSPFEFDGCHSLLSAPAHRGRADSGRHAGRRHTRRARLRCLADTC